MLLFELITWMAVGLLLGATRLRVRRRPGEPRGEDVDSRTLAIGALAALAGGAVGRLITGEGTLLGGFSLMALLVAITGAMLALGWSSR